MAQDLDSLIDSVLSDQPEGDELDQLINEALPGPEGSDPDTGWLGLKGYSLGGAAKDFAGGAAKTFGQMTKFAADIGEEMSGPIEVSLNPDGTVSADWKAWLKVIGDEAEEMGAELDSGQEGFIPDLADTLGGSAVFGVMAAPVAASGAPGLATMGALAAIGAYAGAAEAFYTHLAETGDEEASWGAAAWGGLFGTSEGFGAIGGVLNRINKASGGAFRRSLVETLLKPMLKEGAEEMGVEAVQGFGGEFIAKHLREDELPIMQSALAVARDPEARKRIGYGSLLGGAAGGGMSMVGTGVQGAIERIGAEKMGQEVTPQTAPQEGPLEPLEGDVLSEPEIHAEGAEVAPESAEEAAAPIVEADDTVTVPEGFTGEPLIGDVNASTSDADAQPLEGQEAGSPPVEGPETATTTDPVRSKDDPVAVSEEAVGEQQEALPLAEEQQGAEAAPPAIADSAIPIEGPDAAAIEAEVAAKEDATQPAEDSDERTTSLKREVSDAELTALGEDPTSNPEPETMQQWDDEAAALLKDDPTAGRRKADELLASGQGGTPVEGMMMLRERNRLHLEREQLEVDRAAASREGNKDLVKVLDQRIKENVDEFKRFSDAVREIGSVRGRALQQMQAMKRRDESLAALQQRMESAKGEALSEEELDLLRSQTEIIKKLNDEADAHEAEKGQLEAELAAEKALNRIRPKRQPGKKKIPAKDRAKPVVEFVTRRADAARARIKARGTRMMAGVDPIEVADYAIIGAEHLIKGLDAGTAWVKAMVGEFGEAIKPHLDAILSKSQETLAAMQAEFTRDSVLTKLRESDKSASDMRVAAKKLVRVIIGEGITDRATVMQQLHEALQEFDPNLTERQAMDLFSDYGVTSQLSKDEVSVRARQLRSEAQVLAKIDDVLHKLAPKKTGQERQAPTAETRRLTKELHRLMKQAGIVTSDPETQLASALDSIKTRLNNMIEDIERQLESGVRDEVSTVPPPSDAEVVALRERLAELRKDHDALFNPPKQEPGKAEVSRLRAAEKSAAKSIADLEQRIADGETEARAAKKGILSPRLKAQRARLAALREELQLLRDAKNPKKSPEEVALQAKKTRMANETARLKEQQARGDYGPKKPKAKLKLDDEGVRIEAELMKVRREVQREMNRVKHENMGSEEKFRYWSREILESIPRAARSAWDHSSVLRQGLVLSFDVRRSVPAFARSLTTAFSDENFLRIQAAIEQRENYALAEEAELVNTGDMETIGAHEEAIHANLVEKVPGFGAGVRASNRLFITYMNLLRSSIFDYEVNSASTHGAMTKTEMAELANMLNIATGHGNPGGFAKSFGVLSHALWSPKLLLSRVQLMLGPVTAMAPGGKVLGIQVPGIRTSTPRMKRIVAKMYARYFIGTATLYTLSAMLGNEVEDDVRSSDFGKIKTPNGTRIDVMGGASQVAVFIGRNYHGEAKSTRTGNIVDLRGEGSSYGSSDIERIWSRFGRSKLTPFLGVTANIITGENIVGEETTALTTARDLVVPLSFLDIQEAIEAEGIARGTAISIVSLMGFGIYNIQDQRAAPAGAKRRTKAKRKRARR